MCGALKMRVVVGQVASSLMTDATAGPPTLPTSLPSAAKQRLVLGRRRHPRQQATGAVADVSVDASISYRKLSRNSTKRFPTLGKRFTQKISSKRRKFQLFGNL
jgi:hypothetical protein